MAKDISKHSRNSLSVREKTYKLLRNQLLIGQFRPNQRLTEEFLARKLGVSRTPVREALHKLELEGLVKPAGARGFCVPEASIEEMKELFEIRGILEGHALAALCRSVSRENIQELSALIEKAEQALESGNLEQVFNYNTTFHDLLYSLVESEKPRLYNMIEDIREYVLRYRKSTLNRRRGAVRSIAGHKKIIMALELKDPQLSEQIMRHHVHEAEEDTVYPEIDSSKEQRNERRATPRISFDS
ncbi:MAG: GntR family transcriptional regulator [Desulfobacterales bacterium]|nr:GntR family transcriptional regulator [Desulfobacterales bacterium]